VTEKGYDPKRHLIGQILLERKLITSADLQNALQDQKEEEELLGEILVRKKCLKDIDVVVALVLQCGFPYIAVDQHDLNQDIVRLIPEEVARRDHVIALDKVGDVLSVVMADPVNTLLDDELQTVAHCRLAKFVATKAQIKRAIDRAYS